MPLTFEEFSAGFEEPQNDKVSFEDFAAGFDDVETPERQEFVEGFDTAVKEDERRIGLVDQVLDSAKKDLSTIAKSHIKAPIGIGEGLMQMVTETPSFLSAAALALQSAARTAIMGGDFEDIYNEGAKAFHKKYEDDQKVLPGYKPVMQPKMAELLNRAITTPYSAVTTLANEVADSEALKGHPNVKGLLKIAGVAAGMAAQGWAHGAAKGALEKPLMKDIGTPEWRDVFNKSATPENIQEFIGNDLAKRMNKGVPGRLKISPQQAIEKSLRENLDDGWFLDRDFAKDLPRRIAAEKQVEAWFKERDKAVPADLRPLEHLTEVEKRLAKKRAIAERMESRARQMAAGGEHPINRLRRVEEHLARAREEQTRIAEYDELFQFPQNRRPNNLGEIRPHEGSPTILPRPELNRLASPVITTLPKGTTLSDVSVIKDIIAQADKDLITAKSGITSENLRPWLDRLEIVKTKAFDRTDTPAEVVDLTGEYGAKYRGVRPAEMARRQAAIEDYRSTPKEFLALDDSTIRAKELQRQADLVGDKVGPATSSFELPENQLPYRQRHLGDILKDINTALGKRGSVGGKDFTPEQIAAKNRLARDIEVIKRNAERTGKSVEEYLIGLKVDPTVAATLGEMARKQKAQSSHNVTSPKAEEPTLKYDPADAIEDIVSSMVDESGGKVKDKVEGFARRVSSPDMTFNSMGEPGKRIFENYRSYHGRGNAFDSATFREHDKAVTRIGIKEGSDSALNIGDALNGTLSRNELNLTERRAYDWYKQYYEDSAYDIARRYASSPEMYQEIVKQTKDKKMDQQWFKSLSKTDKKAAKLLNSRVTNYLPRIYDQKQLKRTMVDQLRTEKASDKPNSFVINSLEQGLERLNRGEMPLFEQIPKDLKNPFLKKRNNREGYSLDAVKAFHAYQRHLRRTLYDEPAVEYAAEMNKYLSPKDRKYNTWFARDYLGLIDRPGSDIADAFTSFQHVRTLGFNPRTAIQNTTQFFNTMIDSPIQGTKAISQILRHPKKAVEAFRESGLNREIPQVLAEGVIGGKWEKTRRIAMLLHSMTERGLRTHSYVTGINEAGGKLGQPLTEAMKQKGRDVTYKTQFEYGKMGTPPSLRDPLNRVVFQYSSFPIKSMELMRKWWKENPLKVLAYIGVGVGGGKVLKDIFDIDMGNAMGIGPTNVGQALQVFDEISDADWDAAIREAKVLMSEGTGILPGNILFLGPTATSVIDLGEAWKDDRLGAGFRKAVSPIQLEKLLRGYKAVTKKYDEGFEQYPIFSKSGDLLYDLSGRELLTSTFGPRVSKESEEYTKYYRDKLLKMDKQRATEKIVNYMVEGETDKAQKLIEKYGIKPDISAVLNKYLRMNVDADTRRLIDRTQSEWNFYLNETPEGHPYEDY